jgi:hypothetical protein
LDRDTYREKAMKDEKMTIHKPRGMPVTGPSLTASEGTIPA